MSAKAGGGGPGSRYAVTDTPLSVAEAPSPLPPLSSTVRQPARSHVVPVPVGAASDTPLSITSVRRDGVHSTDSPPPVLRQSFRSVAAKERATAAVMELLGGSSRRGLAGVPSTVDEEVASVHSGSHTLVFTANGEVCDDLHASRPDLVSQYEWCHSKDEFTESPTTRGAMDSAEAVEGFGGGASSARSGFDSEESKGPQGMTESLLGNGSTSERQARQRAQLTGTSADGTDDAKAEPQDSPTKRRNALADLGRRGSMRMSQVWRATKALARVQQLVATKKTVDRIRRNRMLQAVMGRTGSQADRVIAIARERNKKKLIKRRHAEVPFGMCHPDHPLRVAWTVLIAACVFIVLFLTPLEISFRPVSFAEDTDAAVWDGLNWTMIILFTIDIIVGFRTAYMDDGQLVTEPKRVAMTYLRGWFLVDFLATFPFDIIILSAMSSVTVDARAPTQLPRFIRFLRLVRLSRMLRVFDASKMMEALSEAGACVAWAGKMLPILFWIMLIGHCVACGWYFIAALDSLGPDTWAWGVLTAHDGMGTKYISSLYWAFTTVTTVGYGEIKPKAETDMLYVMFATFVGNAAFAVVIGRMVAATTESKSFALKISSVNELMRQKEVPRAMRRRVRQYYNEIWARERPFNEEEILASLPFTLQQEVRRAMYAHLLNNVPFFRDSSSRFIDLLLAKLKLELCLPGDVVIRAGEPGDTMYLLRKGKLMVLVGDDMSHVLMPGAFFGETAVLFSEVRRTATVRAMTNCELMTLKAADVDEVSAHYPEFRALMFGLAAMRGADEHSARFVPDTPDHRAVANRLVNLLTAEFGQSVGDLDDNDGLIERHVAKALHNRSMHKPGGGVPEWRTLLTEHLAGLGDPTFKVNTREYTLSRHASKRFAGEVVAFVSPTGQLPSPMHADIRNTKADVQKRIKQREAESRRLFNLGSRAVARTVRSGALRGAALPPPRGASETGVKHTAAGLASLSIPSERNAGAAPRPLAQPSSTLPVIEDSGEETDNESRHAQSSVALVGTDTGDPGLCVAGPVVSVATPHGVHTPFSAPAVSRADNRELARELADAAITAPENLKEAGRVESKILMLQRRLEQLEEQVLSRGTELELLLQHVTTVGLALHVNGSRGGGTGGTASSAASNTTSP